MLLKSLHLLVVLKVDACAIIFSNQCSTLDQEAGAPLSCRKRNREKQAPKLGQPSKTPAFRTRRHVDS